MADSILIYTALGISVAVNVVFIIKELRQYGLEMFNPGKDDLIVDFYYEKIDESTKLTEVFSITANSRDENGNIILVIPEGFKAGMINPPPNLKIKECPELVAVGVKLKKN